MKHIILVIGILLFSKLLCGQPIQQLVEEMKMNNSHLKSLNKQADASIQKMDQVVKFPDLQLSAGLGVLPVETRLGAQRFTLGAMQMLPVKGLYGAKRNLAEKQSDVISEKQKIASLILVERIKLAYLELQFAELKKANLLQKIAQLETLKEIAQINIKSGKGRLSDLIIVERQNQMLQSDLELIDEKNLEYVAVINGLLQRDLDTPVIVDLKDWGNQEIDNSPPEQNPSIILMEKMKEVSNAKVQLSDLDRKPEFSVGLNYAYVSARDDVNISSNGRDILMPMASVKIPLSKSHIKAKVEEEKLIKESIDLSIESQKIAFNSERSQLLSRIRYAQKTIYKFKELIETSRDLVELMKTEYATEGRKFEELLRVELDILNYQLAQHEQQLIIKKAITTLEKISYQ